MNKTIPSKTLLIFAKKYLKIVNQLEIFTEPNILLIKVSNG